MIFRIPSASDGNNNRIVVLRAADGEFVREFGPEQDLELNVPWGIAVDGNTFWVSDRDNNRVQVSLVALNSSPHCFLRMMGPPPPFFLANAEAVFIF